MGERGRTPFTIHTLFVTVKSLRAFLHYYSAMRVSLFTVRFLLLAIVCGAAYVFGGNTGWQADVAIRYLHAASLVFIVLSFVGLAVELPRCLRQGDTALAERVLVVTFGFFVVSNSLRFVYRLALGTTDQVVQWSGLSLPVLSLLHVLNIVVIPLALCASLAWGMRLLHGQRVAPAGFWISLGLSLLGLVYISVWPTWTVM